MSLKIKKTKRKFYGKWMYKVSLYIPGCSIFNTRDLLSVIAFCSQDSISHSEIRYSYLQKSWANRDLIYKLSCVLSNFQGDQWAKRIESNIFDFYTNERKFYDKITEVFSSVTRSASEPDENQISLIDNPYNIVCNKLPHDRYNFKVFLYPHKLSLDAEVRNSYVIWLESQGDRIKVGNSVKEWIKSCRYNWDRRYILVEDDKTLMMLKLRDSSIVGKTYKYVVPKK